VGSIIRELRTRRVLNWALCCHEWLKSYLYIELVSLEGIFSTTVIITTMTTKLKLQLYLDINEFYLLCSLQTRVYILKCRPYDQNIDNMVLPVLGWV